MHFSEEEILFSVKNGIYAANFGGGQVDIVSGKFVFSASEAYKIENGNENSNLYTIKKNNYIIDLNFFHLFQK